MINSKQKFRKRRSNSIIRSIKSELLDSEIADNFEMNLDFFRKTGIEIVPLDIPLMDYSVAIYYILACSEG